MLGCLQFELKREKSVCVAKDQAVEMWRVLMVLMPAMALPSKQFPASWGSPPAIMTMDYVPLAGGYGHGSSSLSHWIYQHIQEDLKAGKPQFPPAYGEVPLAQTRDLRLLPFGYGRGSGTLAMWLRKRAKEATEGGGEEVNRGSLLADLVF